MFEETNQTMEGFEAEDLPENLFEDEEMNTEDTPVSEEGEKGSESDNAQSSEESGKNGENHAATSKTLAESLLSAKEEKQAEKRAFRAEQGSEQEPRFDEGSTLRVKYNGEERDLSLEEARTLAQKGLNYDHVVQERDRNRSAFDFLMERAKSEGITVEQFVEKERGQAENQRLQAKISKIRARDDDASEETIKSLAQLELEAENARAERERAEALENKNKAEIEGWNRLFREHPELIATDGGSKVSKGVFNLVKAGYSPTEAYYIERNRELEAQNKMISDASAAKKKSIGSLAGVQNTDEDDFLAGFDAV